MLLAVGFDDEEQEVIRRGLQAPLATEQKNGYEDDLPDYVNELPDIVQPRMTLVLRNGSMRSARLRRRVEEARPSLPSVHDRETNFHYVVFHSWRRRNEVVRWNIQAVPTPDSNHANVENTQRAVEEYFLRARKNGTDPSSFLDKYYSFESIPPLGKRVNLRQYCLLKSRIRCNRAGVRIPRMDAECQRQLFHHIQEGLTDYVSILDGQDVEPRPPHIFDPIFNPVTGSYEHNSS